jgi:hypothetical protein
MSVVAEMMNQSLRFSKLRKLFLFNFRVLREIVDGAKEK